MSKPVPKRYYQEYGPIQRRYGHAARAGQPGLAAPWRARRSPLLWLVALVVALVLGLALGLALLNHQYRGRIYPNVSILGVNVGGRSQQEARAALEEHLAPFLSQPLTLSYQKRSWRPTLTDLGVEVDVEGAVEEAFELGRGLNIFASLVELREVWAGGKEVPLHVGVSGPQLQRYLQSVAAEVDQPAVDANLLIVPSHAELIPAREGRRVALEKISDLILTRLSALAPSSLALPTIPIKPAMSTAGVEEARATVDAMLQAPLTLRAGEQAWTLSTEELSELISLRKLGGAGEPRLEVMLDDGALHNRLKALSEEIDRPPTMPRLRFAGGAVQIATPGVDGRRLDVQASLGKLKALAATSTRDVDLVVETLRSDVTEENLGSLGIVEPVGVGKSSFAGSAPYRITNIKAGSTLLDGALIAPGDEFSFNDTIGEIGPDNGFVEGYAIVNNRTQKEWGGGVCQTSTTLFRAAFHAGLPITERHEHSFRISWYEVFEPYGMDAAIFTGQLDLRFVNDTDHWLLLQTEVDEANQVLTYTLYGTSPDREVIRGEPEVISQEEAPAKPLYIADDEVPAGTIRQSDTARGGMHIAIERIIRQAGVESRETFETYFQPWPNIYLYNPATPPFPGCSPDEPCSPN